MKANNAIEYRHLKEGDTITCEVEGYAEMEKECLKGVGLEL